MILTRPISRTPWRRAVAVGALWTVSYNLIWAVAWFGFMRAEWTRAAAAIARPMPWTAEIWFICTVLTIPLGTGVAVFLVGQRYRLYRAALMSGVTIWLVFAGGLSFHGRSQGFAARVLAFDAAITLLAVVVAALAAAWALDDGESRAAHSSTLL